MTTTVTDTAFAKHMLELEVIDVVDETAEARSIIFGVPAGRAYADRLRYSPGQFLTLRVPSERTGSVARCYSLCSAPHVDEALAVTVKRTTGGYASHWLCDNAHPGMRIHVLAPSGTFVPKTLNANFLLLAGGSGITPMMSILKSALSQGNGMITLVYANRNQDSVIFAAALRDLAAKHSDRLTVVHWLESVQGLPSVATLARLVESHLERDVFICGPGSFMTAAQRALQSVGVPPDHIHLEVFRSVQSDPFDTASVDDDESAGTAIVTLDGDTHQMSWPRGAKLLDVLLDKGIDAPFSCREGHCGGCAVVMKSGQVDMEVNDVLESADLDDGLILACQARPRSDRVEVSYDD